MSMQYGTLKRLGGRIIEQQPGIVTIGIPERWLDAAYDPGLVLRDAVGYISRQLASDDPDRALTINKSYSFDGRELRITFIGGLHVVVYE